MSTKEKFSNSMEKLGRLYLWFIFIAVIGILLFKAIKYRWEVELGRDKFYREIYHDKR